MTSASSVGFFIIGFYNIKKSVVDIIPLSIRVFCPRNNNKSPEVGWFNQCNIFIREQVMRVWKWMQILITELIVVMNGLLLHLSSQEIIDGIIGIKSSNIILFSSFYFRCTKRKYSVYTSQKAISCMWPGRIRVADVRERISLRWMHL